MELRAYTDGAARGNPGPSASGYLIYEGRKILQQRSVYNGIATNNYAEYGAVILALKWCISNFEPKKVSLSLYSDSELVVKQLNGAYKVKSKPLKKLNDEAKILIKKFEKVRLINVRREDKNISLVDRALNSLLDATQTQ